MTLVVGKPKPAIQAGFRGRVTGLSLFRFLVFVMGMKDNQSTSTVQLRGKKPLETPKSPTTPKRSSFNVEHTTTIGASPQMEVSVQEVSTKFLDTSKRPDLVGEREL